MQGPDSRSAADEEGEGWRCRALGASQKAQGDGGEKWGVKAFLLPLGNKTQHALRRCRAAEEGPGADGVSIPLLTWKSCSALALHQRVAGPWRCWARWVRGAAGPPAPSPASPHPSGIPAAEAAGLGSGRLRCHRAPACCFGPEAWPHPLPSPFSVSFEVAD